MARVSPAPVRVMMHPYLFFPENWNGIDEHLLLLCRHLDRSRFSPCVLVHEGDGPQTTVLAERAGIEALQAPYSVGAPAGQRVSALRRLYARNRIGLVHMHSPAAAGMGPAALAARLAGVSATLVTYHLVQLQRFAARSRGVNRVLYSGLVNGAIAVSHGVRATVAANAGVPERKIVVIHNGVETAEPPAGPPILGDRRPEEVRLGYFGRLSPEKGVSDLLEGLRLLATVAPQVVTYLVGDGPDRSQLEAEAARLGLADRVRFLGYRQDGRRIMHEVDVVVHVPRYEGLPFAVLEAMAAGRPLVVNDSPGAVSEAVVDGETGAVVPARSPAVLAETLARLAADPDERRRLAAGALRRSAEEFSAAVMARRTAELYEAALGR